MSSYAVLTADVVDSTSLGPDDRQVVITRLKAFIEHFSQSGVTSYILYRGDSLQGVLQDPWKALRQAIYLKAYIQAYQQDRSDKRSPATDIRISIGIGSIDYMGETMLDSDGEAFRLSGRALDTMKKKGRTLMLTTDSTATNALWDVLLSLLEEVIGKWSISSAEVVWRLLAGMDDRRIQQDLGISRSAVSQRKKHAGWDAINKTVTYYEQQYKSTTDGSIA